MARLITEESDENLAKLAAAVKAEQERRRVERTAQQQVADINTAYLAATGVERGQEWRQPTGAHDAYPEGWEVAYDGRAWVSLIPANVWEPGVSGWGELVEEGEGPPAWVPPSGAHDAYQAGDQVTHDEAVWTSDLDGNVWAPGEYGWTRAEP